jgi:hypothetical protein
MIKCVNTRKEKFTLNTFTWGARGDRFPIRSLEFFSEITLPAALWPWGRLSL